MTALSAADQKRWETARARLRLKDVIAALIDGDNGRPIYIATLGAWTKALDSLEELERFVERVEGARQ